MALQQTNHGFEKRVLLLFSGGRGVGLRRCDGGGSRRGVCRFLGGFRLFDADVVETVAGVEFVEVNIARNARYAACFAVLPQGIADDGTTFVFGHKDVIAVVFLDGEMLGIDFFAGVNHGFGAVLPFHEFKQLVNAFHVEPAAVVAFDVENRHEVLLFLHSYRLEIGKLLVGSSLAAIHVVAAN